jgi:tRNA 2-thiouridine synthesizing protein A
MSKLTLEPATTPIEITTRRVDARGLNCPLPILRTKKMLAEISSGELLEVVATDPHSVRDFEAFCKQTGHTLTDRSEHDGEFHFVLRRK